MKHLLVRLLPGVLALCLCLAACGGDSAQSYDPAATAQALAQAAKGADEIVDSINHIAEAYQDQARRLSEISTGVDQISSVVQTNSATAEESAAASQQLSSQASLMKNLLDQFRIKGVSATSGAAATDSGDSCPRVPQSAGYVSDKY